MDIVFQLPLVWYANWETFVAKYGDSGDEGLIKNLDQLTVSSRAISCPSLGFDKEDISSCLTIQVTLTDTVKEVSGLWSFGHRLTGRGV